MIVLCPHCKTWILIDQLNCCIFRHGVYKSNGNQLNPHASKTECDYAVSNDLIYGCGKPFKIIMINDTYVATNCEYI